MNMNIRHAQRLFYKSGVYTLAIDGIAGPGTAGAVKKIATRFSLDLQDWPRDRRLVGAVQALLLDQGFEPGAVDGYYGHNTHEALQSCLEWQNTGVHPTVERVATPTTNADTAQLAYPRQSQMEIFYGPAGGPLCTAGKVVLPIPFVIAWNTSQSVSRFSCHAKLEEPFTLIFEEAVTHYGPARYRELELHMFGGCFNNRNMRGGSRKSTHAYGAAGDLNPGKNQLRWGADRAQFAKPEYEDFWAIVMKHGGTPGGYAWGKDWMHFQFARL